MSSELSLPVDNDKTFGIGAFRAVTKDCGPGFDETVDFAGIDCCFDACGMVVDSMKVSDDNFLGTR